MPNAFECTRCDHRGPLSQFEKARPNGRGLCRECNRKICREQYAKGAGGAGVVTRAAIASQAHYARRKAVINDEKLRRGACIDCGLVVTAENFVVFDFDHREPSKKVKGVGMINRSADSVIAEMAKCDLRCANCHRLKTWREKEWGRPSFLRVVA